LDFPKRLSISRRVPIHPIDKLWSLMVMTTERKYVAVPLNPVQ
jgi:hypothetical protein